ncbi:MAG: tRNA epoxyqueuosine(34) reductase QueG [Gemmatimonadota bacterium]
MTVSRSDLAGVAETLGFLAVGVADLSPSMHGSALDRWLAAGYAGTMRYLHRQAAKRKRPAEIVPGAVVAIVVLDNYFPAPRPGGGTAEIKISKYAGGRDYHAVMAERLERLAAFLRERGASVARFFADAGPVPERELAQRAGLGWIGKNSMLIRPGAGSFFFIGTVFTDLALATDVPFELDRCGSCTRCLDACPTEAFVEPRLVDATRCISYLTIEQKGPIPEPLVAKLGGWAFGCDVCNDVCPWNERFAAPASVAGYADRGAIDRSDPDFFASMSESDFHAHSADTPLERAGLAGMRRNYEAAWRSIPEFGRRKSEIEGTDEG